MIQLSAMSVVNVAPLFHLIVALSLVSFTSITIMLNNALFVCVNKYMFVYIIILQFKIKVAKKAIPMA